jgi:hypothetical protein
MSKEVNEVYSGKPMYDANKNYIGLSKTSVVGYSPSGNAYRHTLTGRKVFNNPAANKKKKGGKSRSKKCRRRSNKSIRR